MEGLPHNFSPMFECECGDNCLPCEECELPECECECEEADEDADLTEEEEDQ